MDLRKEFDSKTLAAQLRHPEGELGIKVGENMFPKEFQDAVANHKLGDVFFVDVSEKQWHYIVKKTHNDRVKKDIVVLRANGR